MKKVAYVYKNSFNSKDMKSEYLFTGENILNKSDEIKYEDSY